MIRTTTHTTPHAQLTNNVYPPGGATALIASTLKTLPAAGGWHGYWFVVSPVLLGTGLLMVIALLTNNLLPTRHYPDRWWKGY